MRDGNRSDTCDVAAMKVLSLAYLPQPYQQIASAFTRNIAINVCVLRAFRQRSDVQNLPEIFIHVFFRKKSPEHNDHCYGKIATINYAASR